MSILKTTKAGKSAVKITKEYLLSRGWIEDDFLMHAPKKAHNKNDIFLSIFDNPNTNEVTFKLRLTSFEKLDDTDMPPIKKAEYLHDIPVYTVGDLELVEKFWYTKDPNKKRKYKKQLLLKTEYTKQVSPGNFWWYK